MRAADFLFGFKGRLSRAAYWLYYLCATAAAAPLVYVVYVLVRPAPGKPIALDVRTALLALPAVILGGLFLYSAFAITVKRLHDRDKSAWWLMTFWLAPALFQGTSHVVGKARAEWVLIAVLHVIGSILSTWGLIELGFRRGTKGANQYGPDPREGIAAAHLDDRVPASYPEFAAPPLPPVTAQGAWLPRVQRDAPRPRFGKRASGVSDG